MSKQNRPAPAYQEYAADMLARFAYRTLTLPQRGLLYSMRLECWCNRFLPESPDMLARILGFDPAEVAAELRHVMPFFECADGRITCPELESYRAHIEDVRARQSKGGKEGASKTNSARTPRSRNGSAPPSGAPSSTLPGTPSSTPAGYERVLSRAEMSRAEPPSQGGDMSTTSMEGDTWDQWGGFTADPEQEGGA